MPALHDAIGDLGRSIRDARRGAGLNQAELAERLEVSQGTVSRWESRRQLPEARLMGVLVEQFGIEPALYFRAAAADAADQGGESVTLRYRTPAGTLAGGQSSPGYHTTSSRQAVTVASP